jgi:hypothetical protein
MFQAEQQLLHRHLALTHDAGRIEQNHPGHQSQNQIPMVRIFLLDLACLGCQQMLQNPEGVFNGTITNDKFCLTRTGRLHLTWWRRPLRSRPTGVDASGYPADETSRRGGTHETSMEHPPSVP